MRYKYFPYILYAVAGVFFLFELRFYTDEIDTIQYVSLAQRYASGNIYESINAYWGPLFSWLLVPFLFFIKDGFFAVKTLQMIIGLFALHNTIHLLEFLKINNKLVKLFSFLFIPLFLSYGLIIQPPDLLFLMFLLIYLRLILSDPFGNSVKIGVVAGLLYLTKAYGFPLMIIHMIFLFGLNYLKKENAGNKKNSARSFVKAFSIFIVIAGCWITIISMHEHRFTFGDSAKYNLRLLNPVSDDGKGERLHPALQNGLMAPPNQYAVNAWEQLDKTNTISWSPLDSFNNFEHWVKKVRENLFSIYYFDFRRQTGSLVVCCLLLLFLLKNKRKEVWLQIKDVVFFLLIFNFGYILVTIDHRYIFIDTIFYVIFFLIICSQLLERVNIFTWIFIACFALLFVKRPMKQLLFTRDADASVSQLAAAVIHPIKTINNSTLPYKQLYFVSNYINQHSELKGRVANFNETENKNLVSYFVTAFVCYQTHNKHYGELTNKIIATEGYKQLHDFKIDFYYVWNRKDSLDDQTFNLIYTDSVLPLRIFKLR